MRSFIAFLVSISLSASVAAGGSPGSPFGPSDSTNPSWFDSLSRDIAQSEYAYRCLPGESDTWSAPNRAHGFRSRVTALGLEVFPRTTSAAVASLEWSLHLSTRSFGRVGADECVGTSVPSVHENRIEIDHVTIVEVFENTPAGLEQSWNIAEKPGGRGPLWIGLGVGGNVSLRIEDGGGNATVVDATGRACLGYRGLCVYDARGCEITAHLRSGPAGVGIEIDDAHAVYPLIVDPILTGGASYVASAQANAHLGVAVSTAGDVNGDGYTDVIVGADAFDNGEIDEGRVFVYLGSASGLSTTPAWTAESDQAGAHMGCTVSTAGDVNGDGFDDVIVAAYAHDNGESDEGRAWVFLGSASGPSASAAWTTETNQAGAQLSSVASAGDVNADGYGDVLVGAPTMDNGQTDEGMVFVYLGSMAGLASTPAWTAESNVGFSSFGEALASAGDVDGDGHSDVIVGARRHTNGQSNEGAAFLYRGSPTGPLASPSWTAESNQQDAWFGISVSTAGDVNGDGFSDVIVGALSYDDPEFDEGAAFVYMGSAGGLSATPAWIGESNQVMAEYGVSVSTAGDVNGDGYADVIVGARRFDNGQLDEGTAFVYLGSSIGLSTTALWSSEANQPASFWGAAVAGAGDVNGDGYSDVIVGAYLLDFGQVDEGFAAVFLGSPDGLANSPASILESNQTNADFGVAVASAGDVNGDGYDDLIVGAPRYDNGEADEGRAFLYPGGVGGVASSAAWTAESNQVGASFGSSVATAGDVNGDGYVDVLVGAPNFDNGQTDEGRAYLYLGLPSGLSSAPASMTESDQATALFGAAVASAGDVNGDGYADVLVGAPLFDNGQTDEGRAFLHLGGPSGLSTAPAWTAESDQPAAPQAPWFGGSLASAGDVNGDGFGDVIVGARYYNTGSANNGRVFVYLGSAVGLSTSPAWTHWSTQSQAWFGASVAAAGDVNGDGYGDVIVGESNSTLSLQQEGRAYVYLGSAGGLGLAPTWNGAGGQIGAGYGSAVASAGDVDGDGYADILVGAPGFDSPQANEGAAYLYAGSATGPAAAPTWSAEGNQHAAFFGSSASSGDFDGNGYGDVVVGSRYFDNGEIDEGAAFVYLGNGGRGGAVLAPQQRRANGSAPVALLGHPGSYDSVRLRARLPRYAVPSSASRPAFLEWEVKPLGTAFDGTSLGRSPVGQALVPGSTLVFDELVTGLTPSVVYHWRARFTTDNPACPHTPWFSIEGNSRTEAKFRTLGGFDPGAPFCFGDGTGNACPCANTGALGRGCANSAFPSGTQLVGSGFPGTSAGTDTFVLTATDLQGPALYFQGTGQYLSGLGLSFGDGLLCAGGVITRLGVVFPTGNSSSYPGGLTPAQIHVGGATSPGDVRHYQAWYRDSAAFCTVSTFNLTNAWSVLWRP